MGRLQGDQSPLAYLLLDGHSGKLNIEQKRRILGFVVYIVAFLKKGYRNLPTHKIYSCKSCC